MIRVFNQFFTVGQVGHPERENQGCPNVDYQQPVKRLVNFALALDFCLFFAHPNLFISLTR